jgi:hypothetical protein
LEADATQLGQAFRHDLGGALAGCCDQGIPLALDGPDLIQDEFKPSEKAYDAGFGVLRDGMTQSPTVRLDAAFDLHVPKPRHVSCDHPGGLLNLDGDDESGTEIEGGHGGG